ncbi:hypothetical protein Aspvir_001000 [Aspergillus viridinutans]|uniref:Uncharacterized protein n=1 Tax=Aspergillus viridinutans TaxID=75553 RepID=A0A9P3BMC6_ASPVI|nr:uncharacterized protein Aspvir_001000 [Aspergillus viridinutans]GIJ98878.1 hypothetical protein Aspvir_001000 [Aspergillus viridinutans]
MGPISEYLYHIVLTTSHLTKNPNNIVEKVRVPGTYTSLPAAKAAAHSCLFDAGYEREFFTKYEVDPAVFEEQNLLERSGLAVLAVAADGTTFRVRIDTTPNNMRLTTDLEDGRISIPLYYVIETTIVYGGQKETTSVRNLNIEGTFETYEEAWAFAKQVLLSKEDKVTKDSFAEYDEAAPDEKDCGYGENVIVHAANNYGENFLISVIQTQELQNVALTEAAMRIA